MPTTLENLKEAFAGESQAFQKYSAFARKADQDGMPNIARLFRLTAQAEKIHAEGHVRSMDGVGSTVDNLKAAIEGETYEFTHMYPPMVQQAEKEGHKAKRMFAYAAEAEQVHARLYTQAMDAAKAGKDLGVKDFYLCPVCGYIEFGAAPDKCPVCGTLGTKFVQG
ncbi:MAG TPA: rubrerythrin family protein [Bacteroidota bacterium]|nr:rubrerythrin family protein [Bacteroidota bacterium]